MNALLGIVAALVSIAAFLVVLRMLFRGLLMLAKLAGFATLALAAAYATLHTAEMTDPDLGGLKGVFDTARQNVATKLDGLPRVKVRFEVTPPERSILKQVIETREF